MASDSTKVRVGVAGVVSYDYAGTGVAPTDATTALSNFTDMGNIGDSGLAEARNRSTNKIKNMSGTVIREVVTESSATFKFTLLETKKEVVEAFYGGTVDTASGGIAIDPGVSGGRKKWVLDVIDSDYIRTFIPSGEITDVGDQVAANGDAIAYEVTITAYPDATLGGNGNRCFKKFYSALKV